MEIFGIGPLEFLLIILVALIIFGPEDLAKAGRTLGRSLRKIVMSEEWRIISQASRELSRLPNRLMREAGVEDLPNEISKSIDLQGMKQEIKEIQQEVTEIGSGIQGDLQKWQKDISAWTTTPATMDKPSPVVIGEARSEPPVPVTSPAPSTVSTTGDILPLPSATETKEATKPAQPTALPPPESPRTPQEAADLQALPAADLNPIPPTEPEIPDIVPVPPDPHTGEASSSHPQEETR